MNAQGGKGDSPTVVHSCATSGDGSHEAADVAYSSGDATLFPPLPPVRWRCYHRPTDDHPGTGWRDPRRQPMKIVQIEDVERKRGLEHRGGTFHSRTMVEGTPGTPGNFKFSLSE